MWITLFGNPDVRLMTRIRNVSARGIGVETESPIAVGSAIKFDVDDGLVLGEVIYCRSDGEGFYVGVELEQALCGLMELAEALNAFADSPLSAEMADPVKQRRR